MRYRAAHPRSRRLAPVVAICLAVVLNTAGCSSLDYSQSVDQRGGTLTLAGDSRVQVIISPGVVSHRTAADLVVDSNPPESTFTTGFQRIGPVVEVRHDGPISSGEVHLPVSLNDVGPSGQRDFFIALYSDGLNIWVPLETSFDPRISSAIAIAPHFSKLAIFSYPVNVADSAASSAWSGARWAGNKVGDFGHDAVGAIKEFAGGVMAGLRETIVGAEPKRPDCGQRDANWEISDDATEINACVVTGSMNEIRLGSTYRVPFTVAGPPGTNIELRDEDAELDLVDALMRFVNSGAQLGELGSAGKTTLGIPADDLAPGASFRVALQPDELGIALNVILGLLSSLPDSVEVKQEVGARLVAVLWDARRPGEPLIQVLVDARLTVTRELHVKPEELKTIQIFFDAATCAAKNVESGISAIRGTGARDAAKSIVSIAVECTSSVLKAADSSLAKAWDYIKGSLDGLHAVTEVYSAIALGLNHMNGGITLTAHHLPDSMNVHDFALASVRADPAAALVDIIDVHCPDPQVRKNGDLVICKIIADQPEDPAEAVVRVTDAAHGQADYYFAAGSLTCSYVPDWVQQAGMTCHN